MKKLLIIFLIFFISVLYINCLAQGGADQVIYMPTTSATITASGGSTYSWTKVSGGQFSQEGNIVSASSASTVVNRIGVGVYKFRVSIDGGAIVDTVTVTGYGQKSPDCNVATFKKVTLTQTSSGELYYPNAAALNLLGGDTLVIPAGTWNLCQLGTSGDPTKGISGDSCHRLEIIMGNGTTDTVNFLYTGSSPMLRFYSARFFNLRGNYRLNFIGSVSLDGDIGMAITDASSDYTIEKLYSNRCDNFTLSKLNTDTMNPATYYPNWYFRNAKWQYIRVDSTDGEGFYLGHTGTPFVNHYRPVNYDSLTVQYCRVRWAGWDGIQLAQAQKCLVQYDTVHIAGVNNISSQMYGINFGGYTNGTVQYCQVYGSKSSGQTAFGNGDEAGDSTIIINNTYDSCGIGSVDGAFTTMYCNDNLTSGLPLPVVGLTLRIENNCIKQPSTTYAGGAAIRTTNSNSTMLAGYIRYNTIDDTTGRTLPQLISNGGSINTVASNTIGVCVVIPPDTNGVGRFRKGGRLRVVN